MSLKKIAEMTGVSPSTVSRVLNNTSSTCASREVRDRIFAAAREIGYQPNEHARSLRSSQAQKETRRHVSIVLARITTLEADPFFYELFRELEITLFQNNIVIDHVVYAEENLSRDVTRSHGVIILGRCSQKLFRQIMDANRNVVAIWRNTMDFDVDEVVCDGRKAAELAMNHLISLGHRNIAYIGDCSYESRYIGYCDSLIRNNIPINYDWIRQTDQTKAAGRAAFEELLARSDDFSAVFCANDATAIGVLELLREKRRQLQKKRVLFPEISVTSIDNIEESQDTSPYLTTINIPRQEMAHMAVTLLCDRMSGNHSEHVRIEFPCRLIKRESCHSCPSVV